MCVKIDVFLPLWYIYRELTIQKKIADNFKVTIYDVGNGEAHSEALFLKVRMYKTSDQEKTLKARENQREERKNSDHFQRGYFFFVDVVVNMLN